MLAVVVVDLTNPTHVVLVQLFELAILFRAWFCLCSLVPSRKLAEVPDICFAEAFARKFVFLDVICELR